MSMKHWKREGLGRKGFDQNQTGRAFLSLLISRVAVTARSGVCLGCQGVWLGCARGVAEVSLGGQRASTSVLSVCWSGLPWTKSRAGPGRLDK